MKGLCHLQQEQSTGKNSEEARTGNMGLTKVVVKFSGDTFVVNQTLVFRINLSGKICHLRQVLKRYQQNIIE